MSLTSSERTYAARPGIVNDETRNPAERGERTRHGDRSGALRAAVFGVNDGLVSNTALVMGFAGSGISGTAVLSCSPESRGCWPVPSPWRPANTSPCAANARPTSGR
ncbi:VIT1/CCC1 transporter family protein [Streptomyces sp. NPDC054804]